MEFELTQPWQLFLVASAVAALAVATWRQPRWGAFWVVFLLPTYLLRVRILPLPTNVLEVLLLAFLFAYGLRLLVRRERELLPPWIPALWVPLALVVLGATISALRGVMLAGGDAALGRSILGSLKGFVVEPALFAAALSGTLRNERQPKSIREAYVWSAVAVASLALLGGLAARFSDTAAAIEAFVTFDSRLRGFFLSPNHLAMYILPALTVLVGMSKAQIPNSKRGIAFALLGAALVWTRSLGAWFGLLAGFGTLFLLRRYPRQAGRIGRWGLVIGVCLGIALPLLFGQFGPTFLDEADRSSLASRAMIWRAASELLRDQWLFGIGPGAFQYHYLLLQQNYPPYLEWAVPQPHNLFLAFWLQAGLLGLSGLLWLLREAFQAVTAPRDAISIAAVAALAAIATHGFVDTPYWKNDLAVVFLLVVLLAAGVHGQGSGQGFGVGSAVSSGLRPPL